MPSLSFPLVHLFRRPLALEVLKSYLEDQISAVELLGALQIPKRNSRFLALSVLAKIFRTQHAFAFVQPGQLLIACCI